MQGRNLTRRVFSAAVAAGALKAQAPSDTVRVAFIGVGNRGSFLLRTMKKVPGVQTAAVCDIEPTTLDRAATLAGEGGQTVQSFTDYRKMLEAMQDLDAVVIATPTDTHKELAVAVLEAGKHLYAEKPMALNPEECREVLRAARQAKGIYQAGFQLRHDPNRRASVEFIRKGGLGRVLYAQGYRHTGDLPRNTAWYFNAARSGDNIVEQACHILDLFQWAIDKPPLRAMGSGGVSLYKNLPPARTTMDNYSVVYEFPDDVRVTFSHIYFDPPGFSGIKERVWGEKGAVDLAAATWRELEKRGLDLKLEVPDAGQSADDLSLAAFIDNVRHKRTPLNNVDSAYRSTLLAMLGRKAIYEKRIVDWKEVAG